MVLGGVAWSMTDGEMQVLARDLIGWSVLSLINLLRCERKFDTTVRNTFVQHANHTTSLQQLNMAKQI